jgi:hypothetical protein
MPRRLFYRKKYLWTQNDLGHRYLTACLLDPILISGTPSLGSRQHLLAGKHA